LSGRGDCYRCCEITRVAAVATRRILKKKAGSSPIQIHPAKNLLALRRKRFRQTLTKATRRPFLLAFLERIVSARTNFSPQLPVYKSFNNDLLADQTDCQQAVFLKYNESRNRKN
jgi:hypothetical protein